MVLVESHQNPIVLSEAASVLLMKNKLKDLKYKVDSILNGSAKLKSPEDQKELETWLKANESDIKKLKDALEYDAEDLYDKKTSLYSFLTTLGISLAAAITGPFSAVGGLVIAIIAFIHSILVLIRTISSNNDIVNASNAVKKVYKELSKVNKNKIKNKDLKEKYESLLDDLENTLDKLGIDN